MAEIVILGAGLGGISAAFEMVVQARPGDRVTLIGQGPRFQFTPSNPWVAVGWRERGDVEVDLEPVMRRKRIRLLTQGAARLHPAENRVELADGQSVPYDYLVIATGPALAFDEIAGFGPAGHTVSVCQSDHAQQARAGFEAFCADPGPIVVGAVQGASCFGPAYEFAYILDTELRRRRLRDRVAMTFITAEPYIGHLGLDGVGDTKSLMESEFRQRHIKWITNARVTAVAPGVIAAEEVAADGSVAARHELPFKFSMLLPAFRGVPALQGIAGLVNPRGFVLIDAYQRNPAFPNVFAVGVCVAIPPVGSSPVPVGVPKTGFMIESMVTAATRNIGALLRGQPPHAQATWNAVCLADFGDGGVAFVAQPQIPPRNVNWASEGRWVHLAKVAFEKYFLHKVRRGQGVPRYEHLALRIMGIEKLRTHAAE
jgi:sulfide:quinone oxidoreductase